MPCAVAYHESTASASLRTEALVVSQCNKTHLLWGRLSARGEWPRSERTLGTLLNAHHVMNVPHETNLFGHHPQMRYVHPREQIVGPKILWDIHPLVKGVPTTHRRQATNVDLATQRRWIGPALTHARFVHLFHLVRGQQLFEEPLRVLCQVRDVPGINFPKLLQPLAWEPLFAILSTGLLFSDTTCPNGVCLEALSLAYG